SRQRKRWTSDPAARRAASMGKAAARPRRRGWRSLALLLLLAGVGIAGFQLWQGYERFRHLPLALSAEERIIEVERGDSFRDVLERIRSIGIDAGHDLQWELLAWHLRVVTRLQVGEYAVGH